MSLTYKVSPLGFKVYLDGKNIGIIRQRMDGYVYYPKGASAKFQGAPFPTLQACTASLEEPEPEEPKKEDREFDLHVWITPETEDMQALVTISGNGSCHGMPIDGAVGWFRDLLQQEINQQ
jgi:hypothetical protein